MKTNANLQYSNYYLNFTQMSDGIQDKYAYFEYLFDLKEDINQEFAILV